LIQVIDHAQVLGAEPRGARGEFTEWVLVCLTNVA